MIRLEEKINLIEYDNMTKESFFTHIFLEEADVDMQKKAIEILAKNPKGDIDRRRLPFGITMGTPRQQIGQGRRRSLV